MAIQNFRNMSSVARESHETAMDEPLKNFEDACNDDAPLKFRPFMAKAVGKLRWGLADFLEREFLLSDVDGTAAHPEIFR